MTVFLLLLKWNRQSHPTPFGYIGYELVAHQPHAALTLDALTRAERLRTLTIISSATNVTRSVQELSPQRRPYVRRQ